MADRLKKVFPCVVARARCQLGFSSRKLFLAGTGENGPLKMRFLLRLDPLGGDAGRTTDSLRRIASSIGGRAVNAKKTSYGSVEVDVFMNSLQDFRLFISAVEPLGRVEFWKDLQVTPPNLSRPRALAESARLFNGERFWEAHEVLESAWRVSEGDEKRLLQGLILTCAAFVHLQKDEKDVALGVARRAIPLLSWKERRYHGIDIDLLRSNLTGMVSEGALSLFRL